MNTCGSFETGIKGVGQIWCRKIAQEEGVHKPTSHSMFPNQNSLGGRIPVKTHPKRNHGTTRIITFYHQLNSVKYQAILS